MNQLEKSGYGFIIIGGIFIFGSILILFLNQTNQGITLGTIGIGIGGGILITTFYYICKIEGIILQSQNFDKGSKK